MSVPVDRRREWFVPSFGPLRFRLLVGMLFLPYTGMVLSYVVIGSMLTPQVFWDRVAALVMVYALALGVGAHALDALASPAKPWGELLPRPALWGLALTSIALAYLIGLYYIVLYVPWLLVIALLEGFFLFAYNLEWFSGHFHTDLWFAISWGALPVLAGQVMQTNRLSFPALLVAAAAALLSLVEIQASRPYKLLRRRAPETEREREHLERFESILKSVSLGTILLGLGLLTWRWNGGGPP